MSAGTTIGIVHSGDSVPGGNGRFGSLGAPTINSSSRVVFNARLVETDGGNSDDSAIYRIAIPGGIAPAVLQLYEVVREGEDYLIDSQSYRVADVLLAGSLVENAPVGSLVTGTFGKLALELPVSSGNDTGSSILAVNVGDALDLVAEAGADLPAGEGTFRAFNPFSLVNVTPNAAVTFFSALNGTEGGSTDNSGVFRRLPDGSVVELVRKGDPADGGNFAHVGGILSNDYGDLVFSGLNDSGDPSTDNALYRISSSGQSPWRILGEGDAAPPDGGEARRFRQLTNARINNDGVVAFSALLGNEDGFAVANGSGLYTFNGISINELVREGQATPDGTATFFVFATTINYPFPLPRPAFNDLGQLAFAARLLLNDGPQSSGVFRVTDGELLELAREDDAYEGGTLDNFEDPAMNNDGLVVFEADLLVGIGGDENDEEGAYPIFEDILILTDGQSHVTVAREGQEIGGRTLQEIFFNNDPTGPANGLNDAGLVAYGALYTDGSRSVNVWRPNLGWEMTGDGAWDQAENWAFGRVPGFGSNVIIEPAVDIEVQGPAEDTPVYALSIGGGTGVVNLVLGDGAILTSAGLAVAVSGILSGGGNLGGGMVNQGLVRVLSGTALQVDGDLHNEGAIELGDNSELRVTGAFSGQGTITGANGSVVTEGGLAADGAVSSLVVEGSLVLAAGAQSTIEIGGTQLGSGFDAFDIGGTLQLGGTLAIEFLNGFVPRPGDSFLLWQAGTIEGDFDAVELPSIPDVEFALVVGTNEVRLVVTGTQVPAAAIIVPSVLVPLLLD